MSSIRCAPRAAARSSTALPSAGWSATPAGPPTTPPNTVFLTRSAALEYAPRGVRINAVCPGTIATPMLTDMLATGELDLQQALVNQPINRLGEPEEIAAAVLWLCSLGASFIIGVALPVDGGYTAR